MAMMTAETTAMKLPLTARLILANPLNSDAGTAGAFSALGNVTMRTIAVMALMNWIASIRIADPENSLAKTIDASRIVKSVMVSMIAKTIRLLTNLLTLAKTKMSLVPMHI